MLSKLEGQLDDGNNKQIGMTPGDREKVPPAGRGGVGWRGGPATERR